MGIKRSIIERLLALSSPHVRRDVAAVSFSLVVTVEEGLACRFGSGSWRDPTLAGVTEALVVGLNWKRLEYAANRQAMIRCVIPYGNGMQALCQIDFGSGWEPLPVVEA